MPQSELRVRLDDTLHEALQAEASARGISLAALVRERLAAPVDDKPGVLPRPFAPVGTITSTRTSGEVCTEKVGFRITKGDKARVERILDSMSGGQAHLRKSLAWFARRAMIEKIDRFNGHKCNAVTVSKLLDVAGQTLGMDEGCAPYAQALDEYARLKRTTVVDELAALIAPVIDAWMTSEDRRHVLQPNGRPLGLFDIY